ncbi:hypothetical protein AGMMS49941_13070 [Deferribacterales bacterium]|nr:hypothetical protein AGMMS49941_13070 [Deferribacterales bacterium]
MWTFLSFGYIISFGSLVSFTLFLWAAQRVGGQRAGILSCAEPLAAAVFSVLFLNMHFTAMDWFGTALIVSAVVEQSRR